VQTEGLEWKRHRKATSPIFNERNSRSVWDEAVHQATQMLEYWDQDSSDGVESSVHDTLNLALNVLIRAVIGKSYSFGGSRKDNHQESSTRYRDSLAAVLNNFTAVHLALKIKHLKCLHNIFQSVANGIAAFENLKYCMAEMVEDSKIQALNPTENSAEEDSNMLSLLTRNLQSTRMDQSKQVRNTKDGPKNSPKADTFHESDIHGNIFIFLFAGHESTGNALAYSLYLLSAFPEWQDWIIAEIDQVFSILDDPENVQYNELFPKLKRCSAIMVSSQNHHWSRTPVESRCTKGHSSKPSGSMALLFVYQNVPANFPQR
jgi:hypothetical protein